MLAVRFAKTLDLIKVNHYQVGEFRQPKRIERRCGSYSRKIAKAHRMKLILLPFLS